jgi:pyruvate dehydrogenase E1 component beta subunit
MFMDFLGICMDELANQAAKMHYMFARTIYRCATWSFASRAEQCGRPVRTTPSRWKHGPRTFRAWKTVAPVTPSDAKGMIISAIRDDNPVLFVEHKALLQMKAEVPEGEYTVPIGKAAVRREGGDVTLLAWSAMVNTCLEAAEFAGC